MPPAGVRCPCIVCGKILNVKNERRLSDQDGFWNQHAEEIRTGSKGPLEEFLKYFGVSLTSVTAFVRDGDVDQVLGELTVCSDCNDWVLYGAFLKEKYLWVDRALRNKIRNAFTSGRFDSRVRSSSGAVVEQLRQCVVPCFVRVNKIADPDIHLGITPSVKETRNHVVSRLAKRRKIVSVDQNPLLSAASEPDVGSVVDDHVVDLDEDGGNSGTGDTVMDYDDHFDVTDALEVTVGDGGGDSVDNIQNTDAVANGDEIDRVSVDNEQGFGPVSKAGAQKKIASSRSRKKKRKFFKRIFSRICPVCQIYVPDYNGHMFNDHHVQPHPILLNNFWCWRCKAAYQPPDPQTPTGQYLPQDRDTFMQFIQVHSACRRRKNRTSKPHQCRFCDMVSRHRERPSLQIMDHEAKFHVEQFGEDWAWAIQVKQSSKEDQERKPSYWKKRKLKLKTKTVAAKPAQSERTKQEKKRTDMDIQSPSVTSVTLNGVENDADGDDPVDPMLMEHLVDNFYDIGYKNIGIANKTQNFKTEALPETVRLQDDSKPSASDTTELDIGTSAVRRSKRARKPVIPVGKLKTCCENAEEDQDHDGTNSDEDPSIVDPGSSEFEQSGLDSEDEYQDQDSVPDFSQKKKKISKAERDEILERKSTKKLVSVSDDDDDDDDDALADDSEKLPCVLCDIQRSHLKLQKHYRVKHNLMTPREGYFGCKGCQHAFLSPNEKIPTGKLVPDDIEYLREFVSDHDICRNLHVTKSGNLSSISFCRYCYKRFLSKTSFTECIRHETEVHGNGNTETDSLQETPSVFVFYCAHCKFKTELIDDIYKHMRTHRKQHKYGCCRCNAQFKDVRELTYHIRLHGTSSDVFEACLLCDASTDAPSIVGHYRHMHGLEVVNYKYFGCWSCDEAFISEQPGRPSGIVFGDDVENLKQFAVKHENCETVVRHPSKEQKCRECPNTFNTMRQLVEHEELKHPSADHRFVADNCCGTCGKTFLFEEGLQKHTVLHLPEEYCFKGAVPFFDCPHCYYSFPTNMKTVFDRHVLKHTPDKNVKHQRLMQISRLQFLQKFKQIQKDWGPTVPFTNLHCLRCGEAFQSILQLREHLEAKGISNPPPHLTFRTDGLNCLSCVKCFDTVAEFNMHFKCFHNSNEEVKFECSVCLEVLESAVGLGRRYFPKICARHETACKVKAREEGSKKCEDFAWPDLTCCICQEKFDSIQRYSAHMNEHLGHSVGGLCPVCPAVFTETQELQRHVPLHGLHFFTAWPNYYKCDKKHCMWVSERPEVESGRLDPEDLRDFQLFSESHVNCSAPLVTTFPCKFCDLTFPARDSLFTHEVTTHTKRYQVYCEECGKGFSSQPRLSNHARLHEEKLKISCNLCPQKFRERSSLEQHMNTHTGLKPFVCDQCGKCFSVSKRLREHVQFVHNKPKEKTFPCTSGCDRMFATRRDARVHEKQAHNRPAETRARNQHRDFGE